LKKWPNVVKAMEKKAGGDGLGVQLKDIRGTGTGSEALSVRLEVTVNMKGISL
jgi:hypothetical protein